MKKDRRFDLIMSEETYQRLARLAIHESMKRQDHVSRAEWLRRQIDMAAKRQGLA